MSGGLVGRQVIVLTAGSLAQHLDASLCITLCLLQLALVGVGGRIRAANRCYQGWTIHSLANALSLALVCWVSLTNGSEATQHPFAGCQTGRERGGDVRIDTSNISLDNCFQSQFQACTYFNETPWCVWSPAYHLSCMNWWYMDKFTLTNTLWYSSYHVWMQSKFTF